MILIKLNTFLNDFFKEGDSIIKETIEQLAACDDKESLERKLKELKEQLQRTDNLFIKGLITE